MDILNTDGYYIILMINYRNSQMAYVIFYSVTMDDQTFCATFSLWVECVARDFNLVLNLLVNWDKISGKNPPRVEVLSMQEINLVNPVYEDKFN